MLDWGLADPSISKDLMIIPKAEAIHMMVGSGNTKGASITVPLTFCFTGLDYSVLQINTKIVSCHTADSKPVKQEVNSMILSPFSIPRLVHQTFSERGAVVSCDSSKMTNPLFGGL